MSSIIVDWILGQQFRAVEGQVELVDDTGDVVAIATIMHPKGLSMSTDWPSEQEIERRLQEGSERTTEYVLLQLAKLEAAVHGR